MYTIGEFSKITGLTVKTLRFYHEQRLLEPTYIDDESGYRYYAESKVELARTIKQLRQLEFSIADIGNIVNQYEDDDDLLNFLEAQRKKISTQEEKYRQIRKSLEVLIRIQKLTRVTMNTANLKITKKQIDPMLIAGVRMRGKYADCGRQFGRIARTFGRYLNGKGMLLIYDREYKEEDADFEVCFPIKKGDSQDYIQVRELPGGNAVTLVHHGPYDELSRSYEPLIHHLKEADHEITVPTREIYLKGPGMIFKGNPKKYLTEIQILIEES